MIDLRVNGTDTVGIDGSVQGCLWGDESKVNCVFLHVTVDLREKLR